MGVRESEGERERQREKEREGERERGIVIVGRRGSVLSILYVSFF